MVHYLILMCIIAVVNVCVLSYVSRKQLNVYVAAIFFFITVASFGHLSVALSTTLDGVITANKVCYFGSCFLPMFMLLYVLQVCNVRFPLWAKCSLGVFCATVFALSCTIGFSDIYYESVEYASVDGIGGYAPVYGPTHFLWNTLLVGFVVGNCAALVYAAFYKRNVSYRKLFLMVLLSAFTIVSFVFARWVNRDSLLMPLIYVIDEVFLIYICLQVKMYDISNSVLEALENENTYAYVAFSSKGLYLGCNEIAKTFFPELKEYRVDQPLHLEGKIGKILVRWIRGFSKKDPSGVFRFMFKNSYYKADVRKVHGGGRNKIVLVRLEDESKIQNYIRRMNMDNTKLRGVIKNNMEHIRAIQEKVVVGMAKMVENRDVGTGGHIRRTSHLVSILVDKMQDDVKLNYDKSYYNALVAAAPMHDLGKIAVDDKILRKPGKFEPDEFNAMKSHAEKGATIVENLLSEIEDPAFVQIAKNMACFHHERWDGSGYPNGLSGEAIPFEARVMAVADVYDALVSNRCYKERLSSSAAYEIILNSMGTCFDPQLKKYFVSCRPQYEAYYANEVLV